MKKHAPEKNLGWGRTILTAILLPVLVLLGTTQIVLPLMSASAANVNYSNFVSELSVPEPTKSIEKPSTGEVVDLNKFPLDDFSGATLLNEKLGIKLPVTKIDNPTPDTWIEAMRNGLAYVKRSDNLAVIAGHSCRTAFGCGGDYNLSRASRYYNAFIWLPKSKVGDVITINDKKYQVVKTNIIDPKDTAALYEEPSMPIVRLVTCTPPGTMNKRMLVDLIPIIESVKFL